MTRPIKFRAWDGKEMFIPEGHSLTKEGLLFIHGCELMQYTNLKDKNGKEIYEGDVTRETFNHGDINCEIVYEDAGFFIQNKKEEINDNLHWHANGLEVIGNIYENPDLLTKQN